MVLVSSRTDTPGQCYFLRNERLNLNLDHCVTRLWSIGWNISLAQAWAVPLKIFILLTMYVDQIYPLCEDNF